MFTYPLHHRVHPTWEADLKQPFSDDQLHGRGDDNMDIAKKKRHSDVFVVRETRYHLCPNICPSIEASVIVCIGLT